MLNHYKSLIEEMRDIEVINVPQVPLIGSNTDIGDVLSLEAMVEHEGPSGSIFIVPPPSSVSCSNHIKEHNGVSPPPLVDPVVNPREVEPSESRVPTNEVLVNPHQSEFLIQEEGVLEDHAPISR